MSLPPYFLTLDGQISEKCWKACLPAIENVNKVINNVFLLSFLVILLISKAFSRSRIYKNSPNGLTESCECVSNEEPCFKNVTKVEKYCQRYEALVSKSKVLPAAKKSFSCSPAAPE